MSYIGGMEWFIPAAIFICAVGLSALATGGAVHFLRQRDIFDHPNLRSSHETSTPRGGGLAIVPVVLLMWLALPGFGVGPELLSAPIFLWLVGGALFIGAVSWADDLKGLSQIVRLIAQSIAIGVILALAPGDKLYFQGILPSEADNIVAGLLWLWFVNLFNFMDGIDGISGVETAAIGIGIAVVAAVGGTAIEADMLKGPALAIAGAGVGFLWWNWHPAKLFLGDVGSVPLGYLLGWLLLELAAGGAWAAALILPLYYLADASLTLARRVMRGEKFWQPHRQHFYQQAAQRGLSHSRISIFVAIVNVVLIGLAAGAKENEMSALVGALIITGGVLMVMRGRGARA